MKVPRKQLEHFPVGNSISGEREREKKRDREREFYARGKFSKRHAAKYPLY